MKSRRSQMLDSVWLMEWYVDLGGKQMRRSTLISFICRNVEDLVVLSPRLHRSAVFFRGNTIITLTMLKNDDEEENLEAVLDVVATHIKK